MKRRITALFLVMAMFLTMTVTAKSVNPFADTDICITNTGYADGDVVVNIDHPVPDELMSPAVVVPGYEMEAGKDSFNPFTGQYDLDISNGRAVARYKNGSVAVLYTDGTFEGVGYDGSRVVSNPVTGLYEKELGDGTKISYQAGDDLTVKKPDGDTVTVKPDGNTTIERRNGLVSEHGSDGKITGMGLSGSSERIDMQKNDKNEYPGGSITGGDGSSLNVKSDGSFTYKDSDDTTYYVKNNAGKMEAEVDTKDSFSIKADSDSLTITPNGGDEYRYEFDDNGIATVPLNNGGNVGFCRDNDGFTLIDPDGFNCTIDEDGRLTDASGDGSEFALRVNPDGSIESGKFKLDENGNLVELNPDGSGTYVENGKRFVFSIEGGFDADDFDWFQEADEEFLSENEKDDEEEPSALNDSLNLDEWDGEIEPLKLTLRVFDIGDFFSLANEFYEHETTPPLNTSFTMDKKGNVWIEFPGFDYKDITSKDEYPDYQIGSHSAVSLRGKLRRSYRIVNDENAIYCLEGVITNKTHYSYDWEEYEYLYSREQYYKNRGYSYDLDVLPYDAEKDIESSFTVYYFTNTDSYQVQVVMTGPESGKDFEAGYAYEDYKKVPDPSQDVYEPFSSEDGIDIIQLFDGNTLEDFQPMYLNNSRVDRDIWYDVTGDN